MTEPVVEPVATPAEPAVPVKEPATELTLETDDVEKIRANAKEMVARYAAKAEKAEKASKKQKEEEVERLKQEERAKLEVTERLQLENQELQQTIETERTANRRRLVESEVKRIAEAHGAADPSDLVLFANIDELMDDDGNPKGIDDFMADMKEKKAHLFPAPEKARLPAVPGALRVSGNDHKAVSPQERVNAEMERRRKLQGFGG